MRIILVLATLLLVGCARTHLSAPDMGGLVYESTRDTTIGDLKWEVLIEEIDPETGVVIRRTIKKASVGSASGQASPVVEAQGAIVNAAIMAGFELGRQALPLPPMASAGP